MQGYCVLNVRDLQRPYPVAKTAQTMREMTPGSILEVVANDFRVESDMKSWCKATGNEIVRIEHKGSHMIFVLKKGGQAA